MASKFLTLVLIVTFIGCESKEYKREENSNIKIINELNQGQSETVIRELQSKTDLSSREKYYLAGALSQQGGVDVFSLYAILEMQLFRKNALEWSDLSKEKNPYMKFMKSQEGVDFEKRRKKREARWEKYLPKIIAKHGLELNKPEVQQVRRYNLEVTQEEFDEVDKLVITEKDRILELPLDLELRFKEWGQFLDDLYQKGNYKFHDLYRYYSDVIHIETLKQSFISPEERATGGFSNVQWEMLYMNILWNTYEAIPLMKQLPTLSDNEQDSVTEALDVYRELIQDPKFKDVALKNMVVLAGVSMMSIYKTSFDLDEVNSIQDLMCTFEPKGLTDNYGLIRKRILFLSEVSQELDFGKHNEYKKNLKELRDILKEELTEEQKDNYLQGVEKFKLDTCFNS